MTLKDEVAARELLSKTATIAKEERRLFAAMAMQGLLAGQSTNRARQPAEAVAEWSIQYADALIQRLNNDPPTPRVCE